MINIPYPLIKSKTKIRVYFWLRQRHNGFSRFQLLKQFVNIDSMVHHDILRILAKWTFSHKFVRIVDKEDVQIMISQNWTFRVQQLMIIPNKKMHPPSRVEFIRWKMTSSLYSFSMIRLCEIWKTTIYHFCHLLRSDIESNCFIWSRLKMYKVYWIENIFLFYRFHSDQD